MFEARRDRLLSRLREALPPYLEPGERPEVALQVLANLNLNKLLLYVGAALFVAFVTMDLVIGEVMDGIWRGAVIGGVMGATGGSAMVMASRWVVVTDRNVLFLRLALFSQRPTRLETKHPRAVVGALLENTTRWGWRSIRYRCPDGPEWVLRVNRMWHADMTAFASCVGIPPAPPRPA